MLRVLLSAALLCAAVSLPVQAQECPDRSAYRADNGYIGTELNLGATWGPWECLRLFGGVQLGYWKGSANEDSPLWREELTVAVGGGLRVMLFRSSTRVSRARTE